MSSTMNSWQSSFDVEYLSMKSKLDGFLSREASREVELFFSLNLAQAAVSEFTQTIRVGAVLALFAAITGSRRMQSKALER